MIIAVNARTLRNIPHDGIGWFTHEVIRGLVSAHPEHHFVIISDRSYEHEPVSGNNAEYITIPLHAVHPVLWYCWHEFFLPGVLKKIKADLFVAPDGIIPLRPSIPCIAVIHDLNHEHRRADIPLFQRLYYRHFFPLFARKAIRVATVSEFSASDISETYGISRDKIDIVPNGVAGLFSPAEENEAEETRREFTGGRPYFLFVSNFSPRKNVETVIRAYDIFRRDNDSDDVLMLAGKKLYLNKEIDKALKVSSYGSDIIFTGSVTRDVLRRLYGGAVALIFVPWFEGFGIPVVEAQRCGTPCILSDTSSLPEVSGGAALYAGPAGADAIAEAMAQLVRDEALRRRLSYDGIINSQRYTWQNTTTEMWNSIMKAVNTLQ